MNYERSSIMRGKKMKKYLAILLVLLASCSDSTLQNFGERGAKLTITEASVYCHNSKAACERDGVPLFIYTGRYYCGTNINRMGFYCYPDIEFTSNKTYAVGQVLRINLSEAKD